MDILSSSSSSATPLFSQHTSPVDDSHSTALISTSDHHLLLSSALAPSTSVVTTTESSTTCFVPETLEMVPWTSIQYFLIGLYSCTSLGALLGNLVVILVSSLGSESAPTIRLCLANLAVSDIILACFCVPFTFSDYMLGQWYHATLRPFSSVHRWLCSHTRPLLLSTWFLGCFYASIPFKHTGTRAFTLDNEPNVTYYECSYDNGVSTTQRRIFMTTNLLLTFLLPLIVLITVYGAIMRKLMAESPPKTDTTTLTTTTSASLHRPQTFHFKNNSNGTAATAPAVSSASSYCCEQHSSAVTNGVTKTLVVVSRREEKVTQKKKRRRRKRKETTAVIGESSCGSDGVAFVAEQSTMGDNNYYTNGSGESNSLADATMLFSNGNSHDRHHLKLYQAGGRKKSATALQLNSAVSLRKSANTNRSKTIKMLFMVMALYGICWAPIKLYQFLLDYSVLSYCSELSLKAHIVAYFACHWLAMANSAVNPIIYSFMSRSFRNDFRKITKSCRPGQPSSKINRHFSLRTASTMV